MTKKVIVFIIYLGLLITNRLKKIGIKISKNQLKESAYTIFTNTVNTSTNLIPDVVIGRSLMNSNVQNN
jgi:hypothetical protein